jgi:DNA-binding MarR family transcriptional regulator
MRELGDQLGLSSPAVTGLVDRLAVAGLARRVPDREDRRVTRLELTTGAHDLAASHLAPVVARIHAAIDATAPDDLAVVAAFLGHLVDLDAGRSGHPEDPGSDVAS